MDTIERTTPAEAKLLPELPLRLHHNAYVVKDHEANRRFLEDLLGIPLVATWCERTYRADLGREVDFCHTFFGLADGSALAFFQFADEEMYALTQAKSPPKVGSPLPYRAEGRRPHLRGIENTARQSRRTIPRDRPRLLQVDLHDVA